METTYNFLREKKNILDKCVTHAMDRAVSSGMVFRSKESASSSKVLEPAPVALLPAVLPMKSKQFCYDLQEEWLKVIHRISMDDKFLEDSLRELIEVDDFQRRLYEIHQETKAETKNHYHLGMIRVDYLSDLEQGKEELKLVELNTIASSFAGLTSKILPLHTSLLNYFKSNGIVGDFGNKLCLDDDVMVNLIKQMKNAHATYLKELKKTDLPTAIVFIVSGHERNIADQICMENFLGSDVLVLRKTMESLIEDNVMAREDGVFVVDGFEVSVVYFRHGYVPIHYLSEKHWLLRKFIEKTCAIKSPSVRYQLTGAKKIQQLFSQPNVLEKFTTNNEYAKKLRKTFVGQYSLSESEVVQDALNRPDNYVLKPQLEGGGNNFYNEELVQQLREIKDTEERKAFILMDMIKSPVQKNILIRAGQEPYFGDTVTEYGFYGSSLSRGDNIQITISKQCLARTKAYSSMEGGIMAGASFLNSIILI